jgi:predicted aconitase with swiveling domain
MSPTTKPVTASLNVNVQVKAPAVIVLAVDVIATVGAVVSPLPLFNTDAISLPVCIATS